MQITKCLLVAMISVSGPVAAHHSFAPMDLTRTVTLEGVIREFQWTNPHSWIEIDVANETGDAEHWSIEANSPNQLTRQGWRSSDLAPGDHVTLVINPLHSGEHGGLFREITLANGEVRKALYGQIGDDTSRRTAQ
jgi:Family of unknown function (DUF6152)